MVSLSSATGGGIQSNLSRIRRSPAGVKLPRRRLRTFTALSFKANDTCRGVTKERLFSEVKI